MIQSVGIRPFHLLSSDLWSGDRRRRPCTIRSSGRADDAGYNAAWERIRGSPDIQICLHKYVESSASPRNTFKRTQAIFFTPHPSQIILGCQDGRHIRWWAWRPKPFSFSIPLSLSNPHLLICLSLLPPPRLAAPQGRKEGGLNGFCATRLHRATDGATDCRPLCLDRRNEGTRTNACSRSRSTV